ncbi:unnamed protein product, partial [Musa acuminata subsp. burmannicoides]
MRPTSKEKSSRAESTNHCDDFKCLKKHPAEVNCECDQQFVAGLGDACSSSAMAEMEDH